MEGIYSVMILDIKNYGEECLWQPAIHVADPSSMKQLVADMTETMMAAGGVGLAANQVGRSENVFVWDHNGTSGHVINGYIHEANGVYEHIEGCLSCYGEPVLVKRHQEIHMFGETLDGQKMHWYDREFTAAIWQHEIDHLNGHVLFDKLPRKTRRKYLLG